MNQRVVAKKKYQSGCLSIFGLILFIFAFLMISLGIQSLLVTSRLDSKTEATIENIRYSRHKNGETYSLTLVFQAHGMHFKVINNTSSSYHKEGEIVQIYYDSDNPEVFMMSTSLEGNKRIMTYVLVIGLCMLLLSLAAMLLPLYLYRRKYGIIDEDGIHQEQDCFQWTWSRPYGHDAYMKTGFPIIFLGVFVIVIGVLWMNGMSFTNIFVEYGAIVGFLPGMYLGFLIYGYVSHGGKYQITYEITDNKIRYSKPNIGRTPYIWVDLKKVETIEWDDEIEVIRLSGKKLNEKLMARKEDYPFIMRKIEEIASIH